jgi:hypothetical protein
MLGFLEYAFVDPNIPSKSLSFAQEGIFLALSKGEQHSIKI